ncbi:hypothetical protein BYZ73_01430 [Rhodovulum viride]|uniref:DUF2065 domain-containing protein n=1 Tax=Rhodovulum viride TaxID=1231134 RepID=A0ABX9DM89_9RHOB|nr:DUF2065 domain-containing protein [Rhodovulum viride]RAP42869.1 hypothetical protein BYZ73_01430 [Rhodovulum viride]
MDMIVLGLGMALVFEGLVFALAPWRLEQALELIRRIPLETRRAIGLGAVALGTAIVWVARSLWG